ncbi:1-phosphofructokinase [Youngiibacter multivorans]|uniref:Tagatose-6-phosphate kinase n=1 Tax=Youngiibacter multivorans TaxID=937251 RepID=A0ABS4G5K1_9CLOT|nr:1-phosphofructokinase [Youngiibacter multivorans]MBP1919831.1 1-phosphofructokinase [Youngiibacter multivorans]
MVITVTLNPALDKTLILEDFTPGMVNRALSVRQDIGGKGINVSKVLKEFGVQSICTGFLGGNLKELFLRELKSKGIDSDFVSIRGNTRTNTKVVDRVKNEFTDINEPGAVIEKDELEEFLGKFEKIVKSGDTVVLSGGASSSVPKDIYRTLTEIAKNRGAYVLVDAEGELFEEALKAGPDAVKPNDFELSLLEGRKLESDEDILAAARRLMDKGVGKVMVSLGGDGSMYVTKDRAFRAKGLKVPVKSTVGAGDSMVAALVYARLKGLDDKETLANAQAFGAATVTLEGTQACTPSDIAPYLSLAFTKITEV